MEYREIKKLVDLIDEKDFSEFELETEAFRVSIKKGGQQPTMMPAAIAAAPAASLPVAEPVEAVEESGEVVKCPIVGTFYRSPSPESDVFVKVGSPVEEDTVVCIVEAMKVMNEIKAEVCGVVKKILVDNATPVEYGQPLFLIETK